MRTKVNQLRRLLICLSVSCWIFASNSVVAQLLPTGQHGQQDVFDPYPANQNPFRAEGSPFVIDQANFDNAFFAQAAGPGELTEDGSVQPAQFTEMLPPATEEADLGASVLADSSPANNTNSIIGDSANVTPEGMIAGPDLMSADGQMMGEIVSEFDPVITDDDSALLFSSSSWFRRGYWYSQADFVMMLRSQVEEVLFAVESDFEFGQGPVHRPTLAMSHAPLTYEPGMRITLGKLLGQDVNNRDHAIEVTFFGLLEHTGFGQLEASGANNRLFTMRAGDSDLIDGSTAGTFFTPGSFPAGFSAVERSTLRYRTRLNSMEINTKIMGRPNRDRLALQPSGSWIRHAAPSRLRTGLLGLRGVTMRDKIDYVASNDGADTGRYAIGTSNDMIGIQIGGEMAEYYADWAVGGRFKAAGLLNFADRHDSVEVIGDNQVARIFDANDEHLAVLLEAGAYAVYQFSPNFTGRLGYDFLYITGIADAPSNANLSPSFSRFEVTNDTYYHGLTLGFEMLW